MKLDLVDFMPPTDFTDIPKYIAASDLIVLPFIYAPTTSRSLLEAMAMGKPIITVPVGEIKEILKGGEDAILVEREPEDIALAVERLLGDKELIQYLGANVLNIVRERFSLSKIWQRGLPMIVIALSLMISIIYYFHPLLKFSQDKV
ncbi:MAG: glycosyltransferase, partial [Endomicrobiia bacterium]